MKILYYIYQICIALPILLVLTILTAIVTIVGSLVDVYKRQHLKRQSAGYLLQFIAFG